MPQTSGLLHEGKPIVQVAVANAFPIPGAVSPAAASIEFSLRSYRALLDTGADISCLCDTVIRDCGLRSFGLTNVIGGSGGNLHPTHLVKLGIWCEDPHDFEGEPQLTRTFYQLPDPLEAVAIRDNRWFEIIIGTDVISKHELRMKGGGFTFILG